VSAAWPALSARGYRLVLVAINDATGAVLPVHEYTEFLVPRVKEVLNDMDEMSFTLKVQDLGIGFLKIVPKPYYRTEIQLWRRDECIFWGIVVGVTATTATASFECRSLELYLRQRRPGPGAQTELVLNPSFENSVPLSAPVNWTDLSGVGSGFVVTSSATSGRLALGLQGLLLAAGAGTDAYFEQSVVVTAPATAAQRVEISAWWKSYFGFTVEDTYLDRGLFVARLTYPGLVLIDTLNCPIEPTMRDETWRRCSVETSVPAGTTYAFQIRLYIPRGTVLWDAVSFRRRFATYTVYGEDRRALARRLLEQATMGGVVANSQGGGPNGDLASEIVHPPVWIQWAPQNADVGDTRPVYIDHDTSADFLTLLQDFPRLGLADFTIDRADGTQRLFRLHPGRRGTYRPEQTLEVGRNIVRINYNLTSANVADQLLPNGLDWSNTLPNPQPTDRDIWAQVSPTPESTIQQIEDFIPLERSRRENPSPLSSVTVMATSEAGSVLEVGDTVPIHATLGYLTAADGTYRILTRTLEPASDMVTYEVALEP
jgi:hypothetical protein